MLGLPRSGTHTIIIDQALTALAVHDPWPMPRGAPVAPVLSCGLQHFLQACENSFLASVFARPHHGPVIGRSLLLRMLYHGVFCCGPAGPRRPAEPYLLHSCLLLAQLGTFRARSSRARIAPTPTHTSWQVSEGWRLEVLEGCKASHSAFRP